MKKKHNQPLSVPRLRDEILTILTQEAPDQLKSNQLSKMLGVPATSPEYDLVRSALSELEEEGLIFRGSRRGYGRAVPETVIDGRLKMTRPGRFCVVPEGESDCEVEIDSRNLWTALHGDIV